MNLHTLKTYVKNPFRLYLKLGGRDAMKNMPDRNYLELLYRGLTGKKLDLENPRTFNEKLQWLKLYDRRPELTDLVDKAAVKAVVGKAIGQQYIIPTLGVWNKFDEIDFDALPDAFVLKCTHDSGGLVICRDKSKLNRESAKKKIEACLAGDYYQRNREWPYKNVPKRILAEEFLSDNGEPPADYKIHCFGGEPKVILVCRDRYQGMTEDFYSVDWEHLPIAREKHPNAATPCEKPEGLAQMLELSRILAKEHPFVRADFYQLGDRVYFGELTFFPASGFGKFIPDSWDRTFGDWLPLPEDRVE